jgi:uncharacterized protein
MYNLQTIATKLDIKKLTEAGEFEGYGSTFGNVDSTYDMVAPGAFAATLKEKGASGVKMLYQHDPSMPIGVWDTMKEDDHGLYVKGTIIKEVPEGAKALALMKAGAIDGLSIGFRTVKSEWPENGGGYRIIKEVDLWEVSVVTFPANPKARIDGVKSVRDAERLLRDAGVSREFAKLWAKHGFEAAQEMCQSRREGELVPVGINVADIFGL